MQCAAFVPLRQGLEARSIKRRSLPSSMMKQSHQHVQFLGLALGSRALFPTHQNDGNGERIFLSPNSRLKKGAVAIQSKTDVQNFCSLFYFFWEEPKKSVSLKYTALPLPAKFYPLFRDSKQKFKKNSLLGNVSISLTSSLRCRFVPHPISQDNVQWTLPLS